MESVPLRGRRGSNLSVLGAFTGKGMIATASKAGAMKWVDFERFLQEDLLPRLPAGSTLVLDNARIHHGGDIARIVEEAACSLLYLPPYSPDLSPIELAWGWIKSFVRRLCPRQALARQEAVEQALAALPAEFAPGWFAKCGYALS